MQQTLMALQCLRQISAEGVEAQIEQCITNTYLWICVFMAGFVLIRGIFRFDDYNMCFRNALQGQWLSSHQQFVSDYLQVGKKYFEYSQVHIFMVYSNLGYLYQEKQMTDIYHFLLKISRLLKQIIVLRLAISKIRLFTMLQ